MQVPGGGEVRAGQVFYASRAVSWGREGGEGGGRDKPGVAKTAQAPSCT